MLRAFHPLALAALAACGARTALDAPEVTARADGLDGAADGARETAVDAAAPVCITAGVSAWQRVRDASPRCTGRTFARHGDPLEYDLASIPDPTDPRWTVERAPTINFDEASRLCDTECSCGGGVDFTYFQTYVALPRGYVARSLEVTIDRVDDGARVTVFNVRYPAGRNEPGALAFFPGGVTSNLAMDLVPGLNRIVVTHVDDCCERRVLAGVRVTLNGGALAQCR